MSSNALLETRETRQADESLHTQESRHKCLIYDGDPSEQLPVVIPFLKEGLHANWRCLYLGSPDMVQMIQSALTARGVDSSSEAKRGALLMSSDRTHLSKGNFEPEMMIDLLCGLVDRAVQDGFEGLCATGDMIWELGASKNFERLLEYEALLERVFQEKPLRGICQYRRDLVPPQSTRDALIAHQTTYIGSMLNRDNLFYMPPELLLESREGAGSAKQGEWMCQQIIRVLNAEHKRDVALKALRDSEAHQRRLAQELAEANRHLEQRVQERTTELEAVNKQLESFAYSVSHDLRAPLRSIAGFSEILIEDFAEALGPEGRQHLDRVCASTRKMGDLIEGLLALSRVTRAEVNRFPVDLTALAEDVVREVREAEPGRAAEVVIAKDLKTYGDRVLLRAVLANLLGNAWKFTSKQPQARIEVGEIVDEFGQKTFFVKDNGAGFDMKYAEKLFGVFQRLHGQDEFPGTGIGLATVQRIIQKHGGRIWPEAHPGEGAAFYFTLPSGS